MSVVTFDDVFNPDQARQERETLAANAVKNWHVYRTGLLVEQESVVYTAACDARDVERLSVLVGDSPDGSELAHSLFSVRRRLDARRRRLDDIANELAAHQKRKPK